MTKRWQEERTDPSRHAAPHRPLPGVTVAWTLLLLVAAACGRERERPHILLITLDTTRRDHLSCYGYERNTSPNLDTLAAEGTLYENCLSVTSWTIPSHASLFTGLYPRTHNAHYREDALLGHDTGRNKEQSVADGLDESAETLAETLSRAGYATSAVCGGPYLKPLYGFSQGFDFYDSDFDELTGRRADDVTDRAIAAARDHVDRADDRPLFLFLNYFDPHHPYLPPGRFRHAFSRPGLEKAAAYDVALQCRYNQSQYDGEILFMDESIGALFDELKRLCLWDNMWVIVTADHGEHFGEHGLTGHSFALFEETLRVPLIMKMPADRDSIGDPVARIQLVHIMPTILDRLGIEPGSPFDALPIDRAGDLAAAELYRNVDNVNAGELGRRYDREMTAFYRGRFKLIVSTRENDGDAGLFDIADDPGENNNLANVGGKLSTEMRGALEQWRRSFARSLSPRVIRDVDDETRKQLDVLGY
jgi:arylsulfatase A-like enzyme